MRPISALLPILAVLLALPVTALAEDVEVRFDAGLAVEPFLNQCALTTGGAYLYVPEAIQGKTLGGPYAMTIPPGKVGDLIRFLLDLNGIKSRAYPGFRALTVVLPANAKATRYAATGLDIPVEFDRPPTAWQRDKDAAGTLTAASTKALVARLAAKKGTGRATTAALLGLCGPRTPEVVEALAQALEADDAALRVLAAEALGRIGFPARSALPALEKLAAEAKPPHLKPCREAFEAVDRALHPALLNPYLARKKAPERFRVVLETTRGDITLEAVREWSPRGVDRLYNLVSIGYFRDVAFFRVIDKFMAQFGVHGDARVNAAWRNANLVDDPVVKSNLRGFVSFAKSGAPNSRSVQFFINTVDNKRLDSMGFAPIARVVKGMKFVDQLYSGYGDGAPSGRGPSQQRFQYEGNQYLEKFFPKLDYIKRARIEK